MHLHDKEIFLTRAQSQPCRVLGSKLQRGRRHGEQRVSNFVVDIEYMVNIRMINSGWQVSMSTVEVSILMQGLRSIGCV